MNLKECIIAELMSEKDNFLSGGSLAAKYHVSRNAVWKIIEQLKKEGFEIESARRSGYRLNTMPDIYNQYYMENLLKENNLSWNVIHLPETGSTNNYLKDLVANGAASHTVVTADRQFAGKGRLGKQFHSPEGGLYMSVLLYPEFAMTEMMSVTACAAVAVHNALKKWNIPVKIKWVNDLFMNDRKICGILTEGGFNAELLQLDYLIIGIGINLQPDPYLPEELRTIVSDISTESGIKIHKCELLAEILLQLENLLSGLPEHTFLPVYKESSYTIGKNVRVKSSRGEMIGKAIDYAEDAGLLVSFPDATTEYIRSGSAEIVEK